MFSTNEVKCTLNAYTAELFTYGYFSNNLQDLRRAVEEGKTNFKAVYTRLEAVIGDKYERRFSTKQGYFSLFYPLDLEEDLMRY